MPDRMNEEFLELDRSNRELDKSNKELDKLNNCRAQHMGYSMGSSKNQHHAVPDGSIISPEIYKYKSNKIGEASQFEISRSKSSTTSFLILRVATRSLKDHI